MKKFIYLDFLISFMCKETLNNLISMYYKNVNDEGMLKIIAFRAVEEAIKFNHVQDIIDISNSEIFSEKFRKYLLKGICFSTNLNDPLCVDLILKRKINLEDIELDRLKCIVNSFNEFKSNYNSTSFNSIKNNVQDYVLKISIKEGNYEYVKDFIKNEKENFGLRSKYLMEIKKFISKKEFNSMNHLIQGEMFEDSKKLSKGKIVTKNLMNNYL